MGNPVILSYGLGVDSTAILLRWILEPQSRDFDLADLTVVTAMTGDEWQQTGQLVEDHILPLMRKHRIRFVQVARSTASTAKTTQLVLSDDRYPTVLHLGGVFKLSEEMRAAGTVPQRSGSRLCSAKAKGAPLDAFIEAFTAGRPYRHMVGFEANELGRAGNPAGPGVKAKGDCRFNTDLRHGEYPLIEWGWDRAKAIDYIRQHLGVTWVKSACVYCPFSMGANPDLPLALARYEERPREGAVPALMMEHRSLGFNPSQSLVERKRKVDPIRGLYELVSPRTWAMFLEELEATPHALYEMRRIIRPGEKDPSKLWFARSLTVHATGTRHHMLAVLDGLAGRFDLAVQRDGRDGVIARMWVIERDDVLPCREQMFCVGPVGTDPKRSEHFESWWDEFDREAAYA